MTASIRAHLIAAGFVVGTTAATCHELARCLAALAIGSIITYARKRSISIAYLLAIGCALGGMLVAVWRTEHRPTFPFGASVTVEGTVSEAPDIRSDHQLLTVTPDGSRASILVYAHRYPTRRYGERLAVTGAIDHPSSLDQFDYPLFLERFGVLGTEFRPKQLRTIGYAPPNRIIASLYWLRGTLEQRIDQNLPEPEASFLAGIMLGSKRAIPANVQADLKTTGTTHIVAISGENITVLLVILLRALPLMNGRRKFWLTVLIATFMSALTGNSASVIRGAAIGSLIAFVRSHSRRAWPISLLLVGTVACLLINPLLLAADPGFQLSIAAFAGLLFFGPLCTGWISRPPLNRLPPLAAAALAETVAATLGTLPLDLRLFGQLSLIGFIVNPLVLWLVPPITSLGLIYVTAGGLPYVTLLVKLPLWLLLHAMLSLIGWFGGLTAGVVHWQIPWWPVALIYGMLFLCLRRYGRVVA